MSSLRHSVSQWCFPQIPLPALAAAARECGCEGIDLLEPEDWPVLRPSGLVCSLARGPGTITEGFNRREHHAALVPAFAERLRACAAAGIPNVVCFSGNRAGQDEEEGLEICVEGLKQLAATAERARVTLCLELLNSKVDHPDYQCDRTAWGAEVCRRVGSEYVKLLYDIYHMQIMEGDVIRTIRTHHAVIAHYHTAGNPGRNEIDATQELNYPAVMHAIRATGFKGFIGHEFLPLGEPLAALRDAVRICSG